MSTPMKKYSTPAYVDNESGVTEFGSVDVYLASEVDARIAELEKALREIVEFKPGTFWGLEDEIKIHQTAKKALGL